MRTLTSLLALLLGIAASVDAVAEPRARVAIVTTISLPPFEQAEEVLVRELGRDMHVSSLRVDPADADDVSRLHALKPDVVVPIGTQATRWSVEAAGDVPIVFAMVLDPISGGLVQSFRVPGGRITGATLDIPFAEQFRTARELLSARRVAVLFSPDRSGRMIESAREQAKRQGIELVPIPVESRGQFEAALGQVDESFDALWSVPDTLVFSRRLTQRILLHTIRRRIPLIGLSEQHVRAGALYSLVTSFDENAEQAAALVRRVVGGENVAKIPLKRPVEFEVVFNSRTSESLRAPLRRNSLMPLRRAR